MDLATGVARAAAILLLFVGLALLLVKLWPVLLLVFAAVLVAVVIRAIADPIARRGLPDWLALLLAVLIILFVLGLGGWLFGAQLADQLGALATEVPRGREALLAQLRRLPFGDQLAQGVSGSSAMLGRAWTVATGAAGAITNLVVVLVGGVYLALSPRDYADGLARLFPDGPRQRVAVALRQAGKALHGFVLGQLAAMVIVGIATGLGLLAIGVPAALALAVIALLTNFVPFFGAIAGAVPGILLALTVGFDTALWTTGLYVLVQQLEGNVVTPLIQRRAVALPPVLLVFGVIAFGTLGGALGVIVAAPLVVVVYTLVTSLYVRDALGQDVAVPGQQG